MFQYSVCIPFIIPSILFRTPAFSCSAEICRDHFPCIFQIATSIRLFSTLQMSSFGVLVLDFFSLLSIFFSEQQLQDSYTYLRSLYELQFWKLLFSITLSYRKKSPRVTCFSILMRYFGMFKIVCIFVIVWLVIKVIMITMTINTGCPIANCGVNIYSINVS